MIRRIVLITLLLAMPQAHGMLGAFRSLYHFTTLSNSHKPIATFLENILKPIHFFFIKRILPTRNEVESLVQRIKESSLSDTQIASFKEKLTRIHCHADFVEIINQLIALFPKLSNVYHSDPVVSEGYSLHTHTLMVHSVFRQQLAYYARFLNPQTVSLLHLIIALHDIGKPIALKKFYEQHKVTIPLMCAIMHKLKYSSKDIDTACAIVNHDSIGIALKEPRKITKAKEQLQKQFDQSHLKPDEFAAAQFLFYISDSNAYPGVTAYFKGLPISGIEVVADKSMPSSACRYVSIQAARGLLVSKHEDLYRQLMQAISPDFFKKLRKK